MESRYDFYRILLPGGLLIGLLDIVIRVISGTPGTQSWRDLTQLAEFIEDPLRGIVLAFGAGIVLYFVEPGNSAPQYYQHIPSQHLWERMRNEGVSGSALSKFFNASDEFMPEPLRTRALLYGAFYRIGFQVVVFTLLAAGLLPLLIASLAHIDGGGSWRLIGGTRFAYWLMGVVVAIITCVIALTTGRTSNRAVGRLWIYVAATIASTVAAWGNFASQWTDGWLRWPNSYWLLVVTTVFTSAVWLALRLRGPIKPFLQHLRRGTGRKPDVPHTAAQIALLDFTIASHAFAGLLGLNGRLSQIQGAAIIGMTTIAMVVSLTKKHENRLAGIYKNQIEWIDRNFDRIVGR